MDLRDVRVVQAGEDLRFALEPGEAVGVCGEGVGEIGCSGLSRRVRGAWLGDRGGSKIAYRLYARVSSKDQEKEGFSIPAQLKLLREYAAAQSLTVAEEYVDVETAKRIGRVSFWKMVDDLRTSPGTRIVLVEKTDRLYRNLKDWVTLDELDVEVHLVKEGVVLSRERSEQAECLRLIEEHQTANQSYMAEGIRLLELARNARHLFEKQEACEKRRLLDFLVSNCSWRDNRLTADFR